MASEIGFEPVPDVEQEATPGAKYTEGFPKTLDLVGKEHGAELAHDHIELGGGKRQVEGIGLPPANALTAKIGSC